MASSKVVKKDRRRGGPGNLASVKKAGEASARSAKALAEHRRRAGNAKELRQSLLDSWNRVSGPSKLKKLAQDDFPTYLRLILTVLPKATDITLNVRRMSDAELYGSIERILTHEVLVKLGYVPVGGKAGQKNVVKALPTPPEAEPARTDTAAIQYTYDGIKPKDAADEARYPCTCDVMPCTCAAQVPTLVAVTDADRLAQ